MPERFLRKTMLKPRALTPAPSHEDIFIQRYEWLLSWALKLTDQDREQAEDLLHDAYIQFTFTRPEIQAIQNVEAYLYGMLRFMRLSQIRRANRSPVRPPSIVEYDSAELGLRAFDPQAQIQVQDELRRVCHYACQRKETSKAGSVLILRFFHGYYPNEIAQILKCTRPAISKWERIARLEARVFLDNPAALTFLQAAPTMEDAQIGIRGQRKISCMSCARQSFAHSITVVYRIGNWSLFIVQTPTRALSLKCWRTSSVVRAVWIQ